MHRSSTDTEAEKIYNKTLKPLLVLLLCWSVHVVADDSATRDSFTPPKKIKLVAPVYPEINWRRGKEGWVTVAFMIDAHGQTYDAVVFASSGDERFEENTIKAVAEWQFQPAQLNGLSIDAGKAMTITYSFPGPANASKKFGRRQKSANKAIRSGDRKRADYLIGLMSKGERILYEEAFFQLTRANYLAKWGSPVEQYKALRGAIFMNRTRGFLPDSALTRALLRYFELGLELNRFGEALSTHSVLRGRKLSSAQSARLQIGVEHIDVARLGQANISVHGEVDSSNRFIHRLLRTKFELDQVAGDIAELRLHCEKAYIGFAYETGHQYTIEPNFGSCTLILIGDPGTTFSLIESH